MNDSFNNKGGTAEVVFSKKSGSNVPEEYYNVGQFSVLIPCGWKVFPITSFDDPSLFKTDAVCICKGGNSLYTDPYIQINYYGPSVTMMSVYKGIYKDIQDLEKFTHGLYNWSGFSAKSLNKPFILLQTDAGKNEFQITIWNEQKNGIIHLEDEDVKRLIGSITPNIQQIR